MVEIVIATLLLIAAIELPAILAWAMSAIGLAISGRGTRQRYVASTIERLVRWPMIAGRCLTVGVSVWLGSWGTMCFSVLGLAFAIWFIQVFAQDEDDFWTGRGKQFRNWITAKFAPRSLAMA